MIKNINVNCIGYEIDEVTRKYMLKKIGGLSKYLPRHAVKSIIIDVRLIDRSKKRVHDSEKYEAEITMNIPGKVINARGVSSVMLSAIDAVESKAQSQLRDYKSASIAHIGRRGILSRFKQSFKREL
jgi:ribosomal subunit interface protein